MFLKWTGTKSVQASIACDDNFLNDKKKKTVTTTQMSTKKE